MKKTLLTALAAAFLFATAGVQAADLSAKGKDPKKPALQTESLSGEVVSVDKIKDNKFKAQEVTLQTASGERKVLLMLEKSDSTQLKAGDKLELMATKGPGEKAGKGVKWMATEGKANGSVMKIAAKADPAQCKDDKAKAEKKAKEEKAKKEKKAKEEKAKKEKKAKEEKEKAQKKARETKEKGQGKGKK